MGGTIAGGIIVLRHRSLPLIAAFVALTCALPGAWAQGLATANLPCAEPWPPGTELVSAEARVWDGGNITWAVVGRASVGQDLEGQVTLFYMDTSGDDAIAGTVRDSRAFLAGLNFKWLAHRDENVTVSVIPGVEMPLDDMEGTNTDLPATAVSDDIIPVLSVPIAWDSGDGTVVTVVPRYVGFDEAPEVAGTTIPGFGDVFAIGASVRHRQEQYAVHADAQVVLEGGNTIDPADNSITDDLVWSAGATWFAPEADWQVDLFATNAAGPTAATSIIAAPDQSVGIGVRVGGAF